jgi:uncharacterized membrane protein YgcG
MKRHNAIGWQGARAATLIIAGALFTPAHCRELSVALVLQQSPAQGGTIIPGPGVHDFALNSEVTLTAIPKAGYHFVYWLGDVADPTSNTTIAFLNKPKIIIAVFEQNEYTTLSVEANTSGGMRSGGFSGGGFSGGGGSSGGGYSGGSSSSGGSNATGQPNNPPEYNPEPPVLPEPPIPEPATALLLALGSPALLMRRRSA